MRSIPVGHPGNILPAVLVTGFATMTVLGYLLDRLYAPRIPFVVTWFISATLLIIYQLSSYPSYQEALSKNGSLQAYVLSGANFTLTATALLFFVTSAAWTLFPKFRDPAVVAAPQNSNG
jgi:Na+/citrate or Na+/malate symporter